MKMKNILIYLLIFIPALKAQNTDTYHFVIPQEIPVVKEGHLKIGPSNPKGPQWGCTDRYLTRDGKPFMPVMGEFHFSRFPAEEWDKQLKKIKAGGVDILATYLFWIHHEEEEGIFDFTGQRDVRRFLTLCEKNDLNVWLRLGPWCHGEVRNGGFPDWLREPFGIEENGHLGWRQNDWRIRSNDSLYMSYVDRLYSAYGKECNGLMAKDGGPVVGVQVENEYSKRGEGRGAEHISRLIALAKEKGFEVPYYSVTAWHNAPFPAYECLPMFGGYPDQPWSGLTTKLLPQQIFRFDLKSDAGGIGTDIFSAERDSRQDLNPYPLMTCEIGTGVQVTEHRRPAISTDDGVVPAFTRLGIGAACLGYYVYHGGTNPEGKLSTLNESKATAYPNECPVKSYDFQAAIRESGLVDERYYHLRKLHSFMHGFDDYLAPAIALLPHRYPSSNEDFEPLRMSLRSDGESAFLFVNNHIRCYPQANRYQVQVAVKLKNQEILVPQKPTTVPSGAYFVWPVNLPMEGAVLTYATAQPLMILNNGKEKTYIFSQSISEKPEYVFDPSTIKGETSHFEIKPGLQSLFEVETKDGKKVKILTLTEDQALQASKHKIAKDEYLFINEGALFSSGKQMSLFTSKEDPLNLIVWPSAKLKGTLISSKTDGPGYTSYKLLPQKSKQTTAAFEKTAENEWQLNVANLQEHSCISINYKADKAQLYIGEQLIYDNFYTGLPFVVGLDRYAQELKEQALTLKLSPVKNRTKMYLDVPIPWGDPVLESVDIIVEKRLDFDLK